jgi:tetratricopeptide (TPR) repeat protein
MGLATRAIPALPALAAAATLACAGPPEIDPLYRPAESVLEVLSVLQRHVDDDTYRFPAARDFTGRNVYRSSLLRLENLEQLHADGLRAGHLDGVIHFAKGRALERLGAYSLAVAAYEIAAERDEDVKSDALRSADTCRDLARAVAIGPAGTRVADATLTLPSPTAALTRFERRAAALDELLALNEGSHHAYVVQEEIERADRARAAYFTRLRGVLPEGDVTAIAERQRLAERHTESKLAPRHLLDLADLYADLAYEYVESNPPEGLAFDPAAFRDLVDSGARFYEMVAVQDGTTEKLEATRRLEAFLAFALGIDRDRFSP